MRQECNAHEQLVKIVSTGILELRTAVRLGDFGRDAQFSLTYGRMYSLSHPRFICLLILMRVQLDGSGHVARFDTTLNR